MQKKAFEIQSVHTEYKGFFETKIIRFKHTLFQGGWTGTVNRELFSHGEAVVVLLYDSKAKQVVLVEQCRVGALTNAVNNQNSDNAWLLEPVAGMIDQGETAVEAGIREAHEEAGIEIDQLEYICQFYPSPGACNEILHLYAADISIANVLDYAGLAEEHEDIRVVKLSFEQASTMLKHAQFNVASTLIALQWLFFQKLSPEQL
ncbi:MAG: ADP-ribose pyrophosphatase [Thiomicrorhabdus sp.]|nr:MAG: ADP-ribose pyrophosphatase [Thiomicrorhabdus sp.]